MTDSLPYMQSTGLVSKILEAIKVAKTPDRFTQDYLGAVLGFSSGSAKQFIPLAKRIGFLTPDGAPTELYKKFRGAEDASKAAMAQGIRVGYAPLYKKNEYAHKLDRNKLQGDIKEITGMDEGNSALRAILGTFEVLKKYANFDAELIDSEPENFTPPVTVEPVDRPVVPATETEIRFGYTINLNLPDTTDVAVFNAIFRSMKENLL